MQSLDIETNNSKAMSSDSKKYEVKEERLSINDDVEENFLIYKKPKRKFNLKFPFIIYIVLFTFILFIASIIALFAIRNKYKPNYEFYQNIYKKPFISEHNYSKLIFDNNLEIILTQVHYDDNAGGALCFEKGYLDLQYDPGLLKLTLLSLRKNDRESLTELRDYMGELSQSTEEFYSTLYFTILNSGFEKFLKNFKEYTSHDNNDNNELINITRRSIRRFNSYSPTYSTVEEREKYLVEFLIYNITDKNGKDIIRQGTADEVNKTLNGSYGILGGIMDNLFATKKMKLIFFSHYKMSLMKRYILRYLKDLGKHERQEPDSDPKNITQYETIITDKVIYHKIKDSDENYIKINYYVTNPEANISQLYLDSGYFNYLKYILDETNQDSLYYNLTHPSEKEGINIKSLSCDFEVVLKNRIRFSILIKLNHYSYKHIKQIIEIVYDYMEKIKTHINNLSPNDPRVNELYYINNQNFSFTEDIHTAEFYKNKAKDLFYRDQEDFFLREVWIPPDLNKSTTNIRYYIDQLRMNNSVIIIGLKDKTKNKYNINETDINLIFNNIQETNNLNITLGSFDDIPEDMRGKEFIVQVLKAQNGDIQLDLSDYVKSQLGDKNYLIARGIIDSVDEEIKQHTQFDYEYKHTDTWGDDYGKLRLATKDTTNDSIGITFDHRQATDIVSKLDDTLYLVNTAQIDDRTFDFVTKDDTYVATKDLGTTATGEFSVNGVFADGVRSTINGTDSENTKHNLFKLADEQTLNLNNVKITGANSVAELTDEDAVLNLKNVEILNLVYRKIDAVSKSL